MIFVTVASLSVAGHGQAPFAGTAIMSLDCVTGGHVLWLTADTQPSESLMVKCVPLNRLTLVSLIVTVFSQAWGCAGNISPNTYTIVTRTGGSLDAPSFLSLLFSQGKCICS